MEIAEKAKQLLFFYYAISLYYEHMSAPPAPWDSLNNNITTT